MAPSRPSLLPPTDDEGDWQGVAMPCLLLSSPLPLSSSSGTSSKFNSFAFVSSSLAGDTPLIVLALYFGTSGQVLFGISRDDKVLYQGLLARHQVLRNGEARNV